MENRQEIKKAGILYLIGNLFNEGILFLTVPVFTRILSTYDYGIVTTYNSWASILNMILGCALTMGIRASFIDYANEADSFLAAVIKFTLLVTCIATTVGALIFSFFDYNRSTMLIVVLCFLHGGFWAIFDDYMQFLMMKFRYKSRTVLMILPNLVASLLSIAVIMLFLNNELYLGRIVPTALVYITIGGIISIYVLKNDKQVNKQVNKQKVYIKYALSVSAPLIVHGISLNLLSQSDRTMITWLADASQTGVYSLIYNFSMLATVITISFDGLWVPFFIKKLKCHDICELNDKVKWYINIMTCAMIALVLTGPELVKLLASRSYWEGISIIPPIVLSNYLIFCYTLFVNTEHFYKKTKSITAYTVVAAVFNIVANYFTIPRFGYIAAAYTTFFSYLIALALHAQNAKKLERELFPLKIFVIPFIQIFVAIIVFYAFIDWTLMRWGVTVLYLSVSVYINRDVISYILKGKITKFGE